MFRDSNSKVRLIFPYGLKFCDSMAIINDEKLINYIESLKVFDLTKDIIITDANSIIILDYKDICVSIIISCIILNENFKENEEHEIILYNKDFSKNYYKEIEKIINLSNNENYDKLDELDIPYDKITNDIDILYPNLDNILKNGASYNIKPLLTVIVNIIPLKEYNNLPFMEISSICLNTKENVIISLNDIINIDSDIIYNIINKFDEYKIIQFKNTDIENDVFTNEQGDNCIGKGYIYIMMNEREMIKNILTTKKINDEVYKNFSSLIVSLSNIELKFYTYFKNDIINKMIDFINKK